MTAIQGATPMPTNPEPIEEWITKICPTHGKFEGSHHWCTAMPCPHCGQYELYWFSHVREGDDVVVCCYVCEQLAQARDALEAKVLEAWKANGRPTRDDGRGAAMAVGRWPLASAAPEVNPAGWHGAFVNEEEDEWAARVWEGAKKRIETFGQLAPTQFNKYLRQSRGERTERRGTTTVLVVTVASAFAVDWLRANGVPELATAAAQAASGDERVEVEFEVRRG